MQKKANSLLGVRFVFALVLSTAIADHRFRVSVTSRGNADSVQCAEEPNVHCVACKPVRIEDCCTAVEEQKPGHRHGLADTAGDTVVS